MKISSQNQDQRKTLKAMQSLTIVQMSKYDCFEIVHGSKMSLLANCMSLILHDTNRYWCFIASVYEDWESALGMIGWYQFYWCVIYGFFREVKEHCNEYRCEPDVGSADMLQLSGERPHGQVRIEKRSSCFISSTILPGIARVRRREGTTLGLCATIARDQGTWPGITSVQSN